MPGDRAFIDSNVLIYAYSNTEPEKRQKAQTEIRKYDRIISTQVLNEFCNTSLYKLKKTHNEVVEAIQEITENNIVTQIHTGTIVRALFLQERYRYSYYDCIMLASALSNECTIILSEDMQHGQIIEDKLTILNPFHIEI